MFALPALFFQVGAGSGNFAQQAAPISADEFWQRVEATREWLAGAPADDSTDWQVEAARWRAVRDVVLPGGVTAPVDTSFIVSQLEASPRDREALIAYLSGLLESRALTTPPGGEREAELLQNILARPEFQEESAAQNLIQRIYQWLLEQFYRLLDFLYGSSGSPVSVPSEVVIPLTVLVIAAVLVFVFRDTLRNLFAEVELADEAAGVGEVLSARSAGQKAQVLSSSGDYRHALRYLYLSALLLLDERGLLRYNRAQTNREYLRQVRGRPDLAEHLKVVVDTFDRVWYGFQPVDQESYARYAEHVSALEETKE